MGHQADYLESHFYIWILRWRWNHHRVVNIGTCVCVHLCATVHTTFASNRLQIYICKHTKNNSIFLFQWQRKQSRKPYGVSVLIRTYANYSIV